MFSHHIDPHNLPQFSTDLDICQRVFDRLRDEFTIEPGSQRNDLLAAQIIALYKQGVKDETMLTALARVAAIT